MSGNPFVPNTATFHKDALMRKVAYSDNKLREKILNNTMAWLEGEVEMNKADAEEEGVACGSCLCRGRLEMAESLLRSIDTWLGGEEI